ncbi:MAG: YbaN family protein [Oscillospiraceae bacterium]|nr:YbaN family protein [Oscillospiraceae bacterium]
MTRKLLFLTLGCLFLGFGAVGLVMPLVPTTPFVLLSAICFSKSSKKIEAWLARLPFFGSFIENYRTKQGITVTLKAISILSVWAGLTTSMIVLGRLWVSIVLVIVGVCVTTHILLIKTKKKNRTMEEI